MKPLSPTNPNQALPSLGSVDGVFTQNNLLNRAADYFAQTRTPQSEWKTLDNLSAQLAEFDLRCKAGEYKAAARLLRDFDFNYLLLWGHYRLMIDLHESLQGKIDDLTLASVSVGSLGIVYKSIGNIQKSIQCLEQALIYSRKSNNQKNESAALGNLGLAYAALGDFSKAIEFYEKQLDITRKINYRRGEGIALGNLGLLYEEMGKVYKAIESHEQALVIDREIEDRRGEGADLGNLGIAYAALGDFSKAIEFYEKQMIIVCEIGDRRNEGVCLGNIAVQKINLGEFEAAIQLAEKYVKICEEINRPISFAYSRLSQAYLSNSDLAKARESIVNAQKYDEPKNSHRVSTLHGIIALRQGDEVTARGAFVRAIAQADEILSKTAEYYSALDAKGLALCGLAIVKDLTGLGDTSTGSVQGLLGLARETFQKARKIAPHAGVVKSVLRLFDELAKCDKEGILGEVRKAAEGK